jgi:hypothetical protein
MKESGRGQIHSKPNLFSRNLPRRAAAEKHHEKPQLGYPVSGLIIKPKNSRIRIAISSMSTVTFGCGLIS